MFGKKPDPDEPACPLFREPCRKHRCEWYTHVAGTNPNTGQPVDRYGCAMAWLPVLLVENSQMQRQTGASTDKVATEIKKFHDGMAKQNATTQRLLEAQKSEWDEGDAK